MFCKHLFLSNTSRNQTHLKHSGLAVNFSGRQHSRRKSRLIGRIREVLALQRNGIVRLMRECALNPITHIHLKTGFCCEDLQLSPRLHIRQSMSLTSFTDVHACSLQTFALQTIAVIQTGTTSSVNHLGLLTRTGFHKVKWRVLHRSELSCWNLSMNTHKMIHHVNHRQVVKSVDSQQLGIQRALEVSAHIPIRVVCHIHNGALGRWSRILQTQLVGGV